VKKNAKTERILDIALVILEKNGDYGVTMRQVAAKSGMSLSNVQYYFKNKDELLKAMADRYFSQCLGDLRNIQQLGSHDVLYDELYMTLMAFLNHGASISEMCKIFREYWAISSRNSVIKKYVHDYYREMAGILMDKLQPVAKSDHAASDAVSIIIPYIEGYSITAEAMPQTLEQITELLTSICCQLLNE
jgi:AcrR family transcriptional regulator